MPLPPRARALPYSHSGGPCAAASGATCVGSPRWQLAGTPGLRVTLHSQDETGRTFLVRWTP